MAVFDDLHRGERRIVPAQLADRQVPDATDRVVGIVDVDPLLGLERQRVEAPGLAEASYIFFGSDGESRLQEYLAGGREHRGAALVEHAVGHTDLMIFGEAQAHTQRRGHGDLIDGALGFRESLVRLQHRTGRG